MFVIIPESILTTAAAAAGQEDPMITNDDEEDSVVLSEFDQETCSVTDSLDLHKQRCPLLSQRHEDGDDEFYDEHESCTITSYHMPLNDSDEYTEDYEIPLNDINEGRITSSAVTAPRRRQRLTSSLDAYVHYSRDDYVDVGFDADDKDIIDFPSFQFSQLLSMSEQ